MANQNIAAVNRRFKKALHEPVISLYHYNGAGFFDGGCLLLADALVQWSQGDLKLGAIGRLNTTTYKAQCDHWFVSMDVAGKTLLLDANGLKMPKPYCMHYAKNEVGTPCIFIANAQHEPNSEVPRDAAFSKILCDQIVAALGTYHLWKADVARVYEPEQSLTPN
jgi:hypothetical protein